MKNHFSTVSKLVAAAVCALSLGSCSRAEYAMLPKGASYHGVARAATPVRVATPTAAMAPAAAPVAATPAAPTVAVTPAQPAATAAPVAKEATVLSAPANPAPVVATTSAPKLNLVQRLAVSKLTHKIEKLAQKSGAVRQHDNTAATQRLEGRLRQGIILAAIGILVEILGAVLGSWLVYLLGAILIIVGGVFIILYLIDKL